MSWINRRYNQTVTRWTPSGKDLYGNNTWTVSYLKCRWEDGFREITDYQGIKVVSTATVYTDVDVIPGDYFLLGNSTATSPATGSRRIINFFKLPSIVNPNIFERKAMLQ